MARPGVMLYFDFCAALENLSDRELGQMVWAILDYGRFGTIPQWKNRTMKAIWDVLLPKLEADRISYETKIEKNRKATKERWARIHTNTHLSPPNERETETERETERETEIFSPPTYQEVSDYCEKNKISVNPHQFVDYYTANGWRIGQNPIADWQAALRSWENKKKETPYGRKDHPAVQFPGLDKIGTRL